LSTADHVLRRSRPTLLRPWDASSPVPYVRTLLTPLEDEKGSGWPLAGSALMQSRSIPFDGSRAAPRRTSSTTVIGRVGLHLLGPSKILSVSLFPEEQAFLAGCPVRVRFETHARRNSVPSRSLGIQDETFLRFTIFGSSVTPNGGWYWVSSPEMHHASIWLQSRPKKSPAGSTQYCTG